MARNVELKARVSNPEALVSTVARLATTGAVEIVQDDTFFRCEFGRLKLRTLSPTEGELIFYAREDVEGPKESSYCVSPTSSPAALREVLSLAWGRIGDVRKHRTLFRVGRTRIHLDHVQRLGHFVEIEVVLEEGEALERGVAEARELMGQLSISREQLVHHAYIDLIQQSDA